MHLIMKNSRWRLGQTMENAPGSQRVKGEDRFSLKLELMAAHIQKKASLLKMTLFQFLVNFLHAHANSFVDKLFG